ncbi:MAG: class I tRNA ligase family protein [Desulfobacterales bacterium]|nr:class I tRNA ligase family protein [Desulfobacterales bacterium]
MHGYWNVEQGKMSKSLGNVVEPLQMKDRYGLDAFRFFLIREMTLRAGLELQRGRAGAAHQRRPGQRPGQPLLARGLDDPQVLRRRRARGRPRGGRASTAWASAPRPSAPSPSTNAPWTASSSSKALAAVWEFIGRMNKAIDVSRPLGAGQEEDHPHAARGRDQQPAQGAAADRGPDLPGHAGHRRPHAEAPGAGPAMRRSISWKS